MRLSLFGTKTIYFIDSENVNENWIDTISDVKRSDEIKVFYTERSTNASYENISKIAGGDIQLNWIKCFTGQNALDFQLVTDLGYSVAKGMRDTFVIISNDKGYDAVVNYWVIKGVNVSRVGVDMESQRKAKRRSHTKMTDKTTVKPKSTDKTTVKPKSTDKASLKPKTSDKTPAKPKATRKVVTSKDTTSKSATKTTTSMSTTKTTTSKTTTKTKSTSDQNSKTAGKQTDNKATNNKASTTPKSVWDKKPANDWGYVEAVGRAISVKNHNYYHMVLTNLFGQEKGTEYYHKLKEDKEEKDKVAKTYISRKALRLDYLVRLFLVYNGKDFTDLTDIIKIINSKKNDSLNSFYKLLTEKFKEDKGRNYYNIYKGIYKVLKDI